MKVVVSICVICVLIYSANAAGSSFGAYWNYDTNSAKGPANWTAYASKCGGSRQSPINIVTAGAELKEDLGAITVGYYDEILTGSTFTMTNTGSSINVAITRKGAGEKSPIHIIQGGQAWRFASFHFHWGSVNSQGSEHTIDGEAFPAELHMIHYNTKYDDLSDAVPKSDGLLVWGHMIKVNEANTALDQILFQHLSKVVNLDESTVLPSFALSSLFPKGSENHYYTYPGSLTTPGCYESVKWVVNMNPIEISQAQLDVLRSIQSNKNASIPSPAYDNYRPTQPLNGRIVMKSSMGSGAITICSTLLNTLLPVFIGLIYRV